jgi:hypothetical protein
MAERWFLSISNGKKYLAESESDEEIVDVRPRIPPVRQP